MTIHIEFVTRKPKRVPEELLEKTVVKASNIFDGDISKEDIKEYIEFLIEKLLRNKDLVNEAKTKTKEEFAKGIYGSALHTAIIEQEQSLDKLVAFVMDPEKLEPLAKFMYKYHRSLP